MLILTVMLLWYLRCHFNTRTARGIRSPAKYFHDPVFPTKQKTCGEDFALNDTNWRDSKLMEKKGLTHLDGTNFPPCPL